MSAAIEEKLRLSFITLSRFALRAAAIQIPQIRGKADAAPNTSINQEPQINGRPFMYALLFLGAIAALGFFEDYRHGYATQEILHNWADKVLTTLLVLFGGESAARMSRRPPVEHVTRRCSSRSKPEE